MIREVHFWSFPMRVKASRPGLIVQAKAAGGARCTFDLDRGEIREVVGCHAKMTSLGNGWWELSVDPGQCFKLSATDDATLWVQPAVFDLNRPLMPKNKP